MFLLNIYLFCSPCLFWLLVHNVLHWISSIAKPNPVDFSQSMNEVREEKINRGRPWLQRNNFARGSLPVNYPKHVEGDQLRYTNKRFIDCESASNLQLTYLLVHLQKASDGLAAIVEMVS